MSTGISISSINRIKELAEERKYAEALEILDTQNLDKSINPQFLRISGEIFRENKRYYDSRKILMKSHQMAPQGTRIIFELIQLYLELGYFTRAKRYYEQYLFYVSEDDSQKEYVEYVMKKALGADVKELASILVPILEQMPEDKWNFEAVLLYDKMDRKDKALEESQYILEHFKESIYVAPIIDYIDEKLDVDKYFYIYPREEQEEDTELFGDLIEQEEKLLEADHLRMYPPEARIMVEAEDKDAIVDTKPDKEKKSRKKNKKAISTAEDEIIGESGDSYVEPRDNVQDIIREAEQLVTPEAAEAARNNSEEAIQIKQEREAALEKLLSKKIDTDKIKESAKQVAKAVKEIDTEKAKNQVKSVAGTVKDNVKKATDALGEAVGTKQILENPDFTSVKPDENPEEQIVDGIIESVLEPPKRAVGQVVMNEELDALIPDSLEAMSVQEIADIEAKKEEMERLELEALEASLQLEEQKKAKSKLKKEGKSASDSSDAEGQERADAQDIANREEDTWVSSVSNVEGHYAELKEKFLTEWVEEEEKPLDSLGFISVVHSDVDQTMEEAIPDAAGMLRQMIDNKEFYSGEDSTKFESKASYLNHGFEVEDYDFEAYKDDIETQSSTKESGQDLMAEPKASFTVEGIYAQEQIVNFDDIIPEELTKKEPETIIEETESVIVEAPISEAESITWESEPMVAEQSVTEAKPFVEKTEPVVAVKVEPVVGAEWNIAEVAPIVVEETEPVIAEAEPMMFKEAESVIAEAEPVIVEEVESVEEAEPIIAEAEPMVVEESESVIAEAEPMMVEETEPIIAKAESVIVEEVESVEEAKPIIAEAESMMVEEAEPIMAEAEPMMVEESEPIIAEAEPVIIEEAEPVIEEVEPMVVEETEPIIAEAEPMIVEETEPVIAETEPMIVEEAESVIAETEPMIVEEAESVIAEVEPMIIEEADPVIAEAEPVIVEEVESVEESESIIAETEPIMFEEADPVIAEAEPVIVEEVESVEEAEPIIAEAEPMMVEEAEPVIDEAEPIEEQMEMPIRRDVLRVRILLSDSMMNMLVNLKESR